jgi:hypothetical protein
LAFLLLCWHYGSDVCSHSRLAMPDPMKEVSFYVNSGSGLIYSDYFATANKMKENERNEFSQRRRPSTAGF